MRRLFHCSLFTVHCSLLLLFSNNAVAQSDLFAPSPVYNEQRVKGAVITEVAVTTVSMIGLNYLWYKKFPHNSFHFFNDNAEWLGIDKAGHVFSAYNIAVIQNNIMRWGGVSPSNAAWIGTATSFGIMTMIEVFDGFSTQWGFSKGDMVANVGGCLMFQGQQWMWSEQRISAKFSYHNTGFAQYYPSELGSNFIERMLKDYNGQTYWISANVSSFLSSKSNFPKWLNIAAGCGAEGMIGARSNPSEMNGQPIPEFKRYRQFYFSFDTDLYRLNNLSPLATIVLSINRFIKTPSPTIEWNKEEEMKWFWIYF